ncbi:MAG: hypothetical protein COB59_00680 [Rhodospirillaceae bacterium]|nr:MAG: hypothetical protein COB59_00680 [Rhodospirillaceae bacterium]
MSLLKSFLATAVLLVTIPMAAQSAEHQMPTEQVEKIVREYLLKNPEVVIEAINEYQRIRQAAAEAQKAETLSTMSTTLKNNPNDPVMGNLNGNLTVVEFFDYRCGYCKKVFDDVQTLIKSDGNIRYVLKEFPILGPDSVYASRAAQAVWLHQSDKYKSFHIAMMTNRGSLNQSKVMELAKTVGIDTQALVTQMDDPLVEKTLAASAEQAQALGITGTPAFIFGNDIAPGAISLDTMIEMVVAARAKQK